MIVKRHLRTVFKVRDTDACRHKFHGTVLMLRQSHVSRMLTEEFINSLKDCQVEPRRKHARGSEANVPVFWGLLLRHTISILAYREVAGWASRRRGSADSAFTSLRSAHPSTSMSTPFLMGDTDCLYCASSASSLS